MFKYEEISNEDIIYYLERTGWEKKETKYKGLLLFHNKSVNLDILLTHNNKLSDYQLNIEKAINMISLAEESNADIIIRSIKTLDTDFHNIKVHIDSGESIPVTWAEQIITSSKSIIENIARREAQKLPEDEIKYRKRTKTEVADNFIKSCKLAHTWRGSFGFTIESPLSLPGIASIKDIHENYERRVSKRMYLGFKILKESTDNKSVDYILDNLSVGFDGNMMKQFVEIANDLKYTPITYNVNWSPTIKIDNAIKKYNIIELDRDNYRMAEKALSKMLTNDEDIEIKFTGFPEGLKSSKELLLSNKLAGDRTIMVRGYSKEIDKAVLKMELDWDNYQNALHAHENKNDVRVHCIVKKKQKGWEVLKVIDFKVLD
ncbi:MAG: hypothetical protein AB2L26_11035 [Ignavibacteria bacterium]